MVANLAIVHAFTTGMAKHSAGIACLSYRVGMRATRYRRRRMIRVEKCWFWVDAVRIHVGYWRWIKHDRHEWRWRVHAVVVVIDAFFKLSKRATTAGNSGGIVYRRVSATAAATIGTGACRV